MLMILNDHAKCSDAVSTDEGNSSNKGQTKVCLPVRGSECSQCTFTVL